jgi:hypothetical protein
VDPSARKGRNDHRAGPGAYGLCGFDGQQRYPGRPERRPERFGHRAADGGVDGADDAACSFDVEDADARGHRQFFEDQSRQVVGAVDLWFVRFLWLDAVIGSLRSFHVGRSFQRVNSFFRRVNSPRHRDDFVAADRERLIGRSDDAHDRLLRLDDRRGAG